MNIQNCLQDLCSYFDLDKEYDGMCLPPKFIFHKDRLHYIFLQHKEAQMDSSIARREHVR